jgi:uncharacterized membrane protein
MVAIGVEERRKARAAQPGFSNAPERGRPYSRTTVAVPSAVASWFPSTPGTAPSGLASNVAGMIAYVTIIPAIIFLVLEPYNKDKSVRFHAFQSLFFHIAWLIVIVAAMLVGLILQLIPVVGWILDIALWLTIGLGGFALWVFLLVKAYGNAKFELPVIGRMAAQHAPR